MLSHTHPMSDPDAIFEIDPTTRIISTNVKKIVLMQYDHNSEIFTFSIPQFVEGHDMSLCNKIEIHYTNINKRTREQSKNIYPVTDKHVKDNNLVFTWLPSCNATKYPGSLNFIIRFECVEDDGSISYMWHTDIFKNVTVSDVISNTESVIADYSDILEQWKNDIINEIPQADYEQNDSTAKDYIKNRPFYSSGIVEDTLLDGTFDFVENPDFGLYQYSEESSAIFEELKTYTVIFDGTSYSCTGYIPMEEAPAVLGNVSLLGVSGGNNEPFLMLTADSHLVIYTNSTDASHTVKIIDPRETIKKLDEKYLPDEIRKTPSSKMDKINPTGTGSFSLNREVSTTIGNYSFAEGYCTTASAHSSHAEGDSTTASAHASHAEGIGTTASGNQSHAEGSNTTASGSYSHAEGAVTTASGNFSHAEGRNTTASGISSHAEGESTNRFSAVVTATNPTDADIITAWKSKKFSLAKGTSSHVEGKDSLALSDYSHAEGNYTTESGTSSHAEGNSTNASGSNYKCE